MEKTYLELLAENDSEAREDYISPRELFLDHNEYEDNVEPHGKNHDELDDQEEFQKHGGSHQQASQLKELPNTKTEHTTSVQFNKSVQKHVLNIDSRFRTRKADPKNDFMYTLITPIKNVVSLTVSSIEIPNTWYTFSKEKGNTTFSILINFSTYKITLPDGNYSLDTNLDNCLQTKLTSIINSVTGQTFVITFSTVSSLFTFTNPIPFRFDFSEGIFNTREENWGIGYNLGFRDKSFTNSTRITPLLTTLNTVAFPDILGSNYIFLSLHPDWRNIKHKSNGNTNISAFAKIIVNVNKNDIIYEDGSNLITKTYDLKQPTNISSFKISLFDEYGQLINLMGGDISLTLETTEVLDSSLYETLRN